jgi:hypothetical protein
MSSAHFAIALDLPPAPPTGLTAVPGDGSVSLSWMAHPEADVVGYRVYRGDAAGGPYVPLAETALPDYDDMGLVNDVTVYYVVTALDSYSESDYSSEVAATPQGPPALEAEIRLKHEEVRAECILPRPYDGDDHDDADDDVACHGGRHGCPRWIQATIELPLGHDPASIEPSSVRLAGSVGPDPRHWKIVDKDHDKIRELELRFSFNPVAPLLEVGENELSLTGLAAGQGFRGVGLISVTPPRTDLHIKPDLLKHKNRHQDVEARLKFKKPLQGRAVEIESVRLNETVPVKRVVRYDRDLVVTFDRSAVDAVLPTGKRVEVRVSGLVAGLPFTGVDQVKVIE